MTLLAITVLAFAGQSPDGPLLNSEDLHLAFFKTPVVMQAAWERGEKDAPKFRDASAQFNKFRRGIGKVRTAPLREETVSWLWITPPETFAYCIGFDTKKRYASTEDIDRWKGILIPKGPTYLKSFEVGGTISLFPSWGGSGGRIDRYANPNDLTDVRVVLKVGERVYQPVEQPGNLLSYTGTGTSSYNQTNYDYSTSSTTATASGPGGTARGTANTQTVRQYNTMHEQGYDWYQGSFRVTFSLFDRAGAPIVKKSDKEMTVIVIYGTNERKVTYKLQDLVNPL